MSPQVHRQSYAEVRVGRYLECAVVQSLLHSSTIAFLCQKNRESENLLDREMGLLESAQCYWKIQIRLQLNERANAADVPLLRLLCMHAGSSLSLRDRGQKAGWRPKSSNTTNLKANLQAGTRADLLLAFLLTRALPCLLLPLIRGTLARWLAIDDSRLRSCTASR